MELISEENNSYCSFQKTQSMLEGGRTDAGGIGAPGRGARLPVVQVFPPEQPAGL